MPLIRLTALCLAVLTFCVLTAYADDAEKKPVKPIPLDTLKLDITPLGKWGATPYRVVTMDEEQTPPAEVPHGKVTFRTKVDGGKLVYDDAGRVGAEDDDRPWVFEWHAEMTKTSAMQMSLLDYSYGENEAQMTVIMTVKDRQAKIETTKKGETTTQDKEWPEVVITDFMLVRLAAVLPQEKDKTYLIENFFSRAGYSTSIDGVRHLVCKGVDEKSGAEGDRWVRFELMNPNPNVEDGEDPNTPEMILWVDKDRKVRKISQGGYILHLVTTPAAK